ncbi:MULTISPECIES: N-acetyl-gamma-glutamyl-phosphate reductase [unclassified Microbacterium]|uniref:N-acetyl-gamma-glutamyl-phosphate reductase n=1 Tax=unclassified Microbacterium TaxID=2609290 RepID=UPI000CFDCD0D|nr:MULTISPECIES: N-acetyl-gamma-glutamyl-phosphate reductase [unclassified Microbacterium]PQZ52705.1 N-acetyl-gamma-glutamyl-phosphate reductase [Microbacterium sp. MYb43]PQZ74360.1 N-acetyl-gamma-glutamyl-phosphate reductase [Microbacterium sp. MYb40]PRB18137.1 N-acetyl-gamma-glutamyl-phosphate reductase [Microbacterium sp. MYb54]PRB23480.1 N-acetyl-gamma-glutamyl-phosphate reductase [Microbacterium sp. MYb50]PRB62123.1 N-acetyl-gamma-glutamyl-phosphate reductase [Microbacterium sp. MYb24]
MTYSVAVSGASGYAGGEILRILADHPDIEIRTVTAHSNAGQPLIDHQPHLRSLAHLTLQDTTPEILAGHDIVFLALPHGQSGQYTDALGDTALVIDAGADHRLTSASAWEAFYGGTFHEPWTYGVPELLVGGGKQRENLHGATRIAAPGCNASTVSLSLAPGVAAGVIDPSDIVSVLAVGPSGAGKSLKTNLLGSEILGTANPYAVGGSHRHIPEIRQALAAASGADADGIRISFTPVLVPMSRGILATSTAPIVEGVTDEQIRDAWQNAYGDETFVQLLPEGRFPRTADVLGANTALIGLAIDRAANRVTVVTAVDNLVKGTAGAAIQSMNIALGLPENRALSVNGVAP